MSPVYIDPAEMADTARVLQQVATTLTGVAGQVHASCCCCVAPRGVAGEVEATSAALQALLRALSDGIVADADDLAQRGELIAADASLGSAVSAAWGGPAADPNGLYPTSVTIGGSSYPSWTITDGSGQPVDSSSLYPTSVTIGGSSYPSWTITDGAGNPVDPSDLYPTYATIGGSPNYDLGVLGGAMRIGEFVANKEQELRKQLWSMASTPGALELISALDTLDSNRINSWGVVYNPHLESEDGFLKRSGQTYGPYGNMRPLGL
jgi:hypothetical protein